MGQKGSFSNSHDEEEDDEIFIPHTRASVKPSHRRIAANALGLAVPDSACEAATAVEESLLAGHKWYFVDPSAACRDSGIYQEWTTSKPSGRDIVQVTCREVEEEGELTKVFDYEGEMDGDAFHMDGEFRVERGRGEVFVLAMTVFRDIVAGHVFGEQPVMRYAVTSHARDRLQVIRTDDQ